MCRATLPIAVLSLALAVGPVRAGEAPAAEPGTHVDMPLLMAPMSKDGLLLGYAYIRSVLIASSPRAALAIRDKIAFIQDAFVRDVNAAPVGQASDPTKVDVDLLARRLTSDARRVVGADKIADIAFGGGRDAGIQFGPLHPREASQAAEAPPPPAAAATAAAPSH
jgi:hypothetical protein